MAVLLGHVVAAAAPAPHPFFVKEISYPVIGVVLFFVISGFLLYRPFVAARLLGARPVTIRDYGRRRLLRILPAYWTALTLLTIWPGLYGVSERPVVFYGLVQSFRPLLSGLWCPNTPCGIGPTWSLSVEALFYAVLPLIVILMGRITRDRPRRTKLVTELVVLSCLALASLSIDAIWIPRPKAYLVQLLLRPDEFAGTFCWLVCGMLLAVLSVTMQNRPAARNGVWTKRSHGTIAWSLALVVYLVTAALLPPDPSWPTWNGPMVVAMFISFSVVAVLLISPAIFSDHSDGLVQRFLGSRPLRWLGLISYGVFLWHIPIMTELKYLRVSNGSSHPILILASLTFVLAMACGAASYYLVERPFLQLKDRRRVLSDLRAGSSTSGPRPAAMPAVPARRRTLQPVMTAAVLAVIAFVLAQAVGFGDPRRTQTFVGRAFAIQFKYPAELRGRRIRQPRGISVRVLTAGKYSLVVVRLPLPSASSQQALLGVLRQRELGFLKVHPFDRIRSEVSVRYAGLPGIAYHLTAHRAAVEQWDTLLLDGDVEYKLICQARAGYVAHMEHACSMMLGSLSAR